MKNFRYSTFWSMLVLLSVVALGCKKDKDIQDAEPQASSTSLYEVPAHFPPMFVPEDNQPTAERIALGKDLFYDKILSKDQKVSCAGCHHPQLAFGDSLPFSIGVRRQLSLRNSMPLSNIGYSTSFFWDGGVPTLEQQALAPIENPIEMDLPLDEAVRRLNEHASYPARFREAYGRDPDLFSLTRALAAFERSLLSGNSAYDRYLLGDSSALNADQKAGKDIFFSETAECFHCHTGVLFTDFSFQNNGLYAVYTDEGRAVITGNPRDVGKFKVPSLRNVAQTGPYMHDGSIATLEGVLDHYQSGGKGHRNQNPVLRPFELSQQERRQVVTFLRSLSDPSFLTDPDHRP